jgi:predicted ATPase
MELLYVWIEEYNNIKRQGFNFSPKHRFEFTPTAYNIDRKVTHGTLTYKKGATNYPDSFFGNNIRNITAIVGKNGSGKSSLIKALYDGMLVMQTYIFIFETEKEEEQGKRETEIFCCSNIELDIKFNTLILNNEPIPLLLDKNHNRFIDKFIYYSPFINSNRNYLRSFDLNNNIGNMVQMATALSSVAHNPNSEATAAATKQIYHHFLSAYCAQEMTTQISFIKEITGRKPQIIPAEIVIPQEVELGIPFYGKDLPTCKTECPNPDDFPLYMVVDALNQDMLQKGIVREEEFSYIIPLKEADAWFEDICNKRGYNKEEIKAFCNQLNDKTPDLFNYGDEKEGRVLNFTFPYLSLPQEILLKRETGARSSWANDLAVTLTWHDLSDGEATMLSLFARLWEKLQKTNHSCIVLLDEFELGLHPQWQKESITRLIKFFELINKGRHQLILTSHSPFLLSDLPRENVIFLNVEKDEKGNPRCKVCEPKDNDMERTFGANIHSLYRSSFFMQDGLMGEFAKGKIDGVIGDLRGKRKIKESRKNEIRFIIDTIGEDILRTGLEKLYEEKFSLTEKQRIVKEIEHLKKKLKALN